MAELDQGLPTPYTKLRLKAGMAALVYGAPEELVELLALPGTVRSLSGGRIDSKCPDRQSTLGEAGFALTFARNQAEAVRRIGELEPALQSGAVVWIAYPKGSKAAGYDVSRDTIWRAANVAGSVLNANVAIDSKWSAVRLRKAKPGELD